MLVNVNKSKSARLVTADDFLKTAPTDEEQFLAAMAQAFNAATEE